MQLLISNTRNSDFQFDMNSGCCIVIPFACCSDRDSYNFGICITVELKGWPLVKPELLEKVGKFSMARFSCVVFKRWSPIQKLINEHSDRL